MYNRQRTRRNKSEITFVEVLDAGVVQWLSDDFLQAVFAASAAGVHLHIAKAQLLQANTQDTVKNRQEYICPMESWM